MTKTPTCGTTTTLPETIVSTVKLVHGFDPASNCDDHVVVPAGGSGRLHVRVTLENFYRSLCPGPVAAIDILAPNGTTWGHLATQQLPTFDCQYHIERNETLAPGTWTLKYAGGSVNPSTGRAYLASLIEIQAT